MNNIIEVSDLTKQFNQYIAVNHINFSVHSGELFAFLGTNGAGKSTTINMLCSLLSKTSGTILIDGFNMDDDAAEIRRRIGIVFQGNVLDDLLSVQDNLNLRGHFQGLSGRDLKQRLATLTEILDLAEIWRQPYGKLSGGQKRKCEIARALLGNPRLLILDEPTTGLDPQTRENIWKLIRSLQKEQGMTVFLTTHYMEEAATADNIVIIEKGTICAEGTPLNLKAQYSKDLLRIHLSDPKTGRLELQRLGYHANWESGWLTVNVPNGRTALNLLNHVDGILDFELVKGNMDDVFLAVTRCHKEGSS